MLKKLLLHTVFFWCIAGYHSAAEAQQISDKPDTLRLTIVDLERRFLDSNITLLASYYNINSGKALEEQARKWDNPTLLTDQNIYSNNAFFRHRKTASGAIDGQVFVQVQQLIKTAGKRGKQMDLAKTSTNINYWQFKQVMRELRYNLIRDCYTLDRLLELASMYSQNLERLNKLQDVTQRQFAAGNVAKKEYLRIQSLIVSQSKDIAENDKDIADLESELKTLLQITGNTVIKPVIAANSDNRLQVSLNDIVDSATKHNTDFNLQLEQAKYSNQYLTLQKAIAVPDLTTGVEYDQNSNYTPNYYGLSLNIPIPIFNRNQGNIKAANWQLKADQAKLKQAYDKLQNDISAAYQKYAIAQKLVTVKGETFYNDYAELYKNITESYNNRQISLIEFLTYFNDYQDVRKNQMDAMLNLDLAKLEINDLAGTDIIK